jgi:CheY-like chemotaxis protein
MMRVVLVDDEAPARARLTALLAEAGGVTVVGEAANADDARAVIAQATPDAVFLDIEMPAERGTDLAASLPEPRPFVVFATAYERFAVDAFQYDPADYLLKPVNRQRLAQTLDRLRAKIAARRDTEREWSAAARAQAHLLPRSLPDCPAIDGRAHAAGPRRGRRLRRHDRRGPPRHSSSGTSPARAWPPGSSPERAGTLAGGDAAARSHGRRDDDGAQPRYPRLHRRLALRHPRACAARAGKRRRALRERGASAPLVIGTGGAPFGLDVTAPAVGLLDAPEFADAAHVLGPGDTLVVVSDG